MTRINLILPQDLYDQHLMAEYRELPMVLASLRRSLRSLNFNVGKIPKEFKLNTGHVMFFYNKLIFLEKRYDLLCEELLNRKFNINPKYRLVDFMGFPQWCYKDWTPTERDKQVSRNRIVEKINQKPDWYRKS